MGYMRHHAIIVTSWDELKIKIAHEVAQVFFPNITDIVKSELNGYQSFLVPPDGSKEGWEESNTGDKRRNEYIYWLNKQKHEDGSSPLGWTEVQYGDDDKKTRIVRHSDQKQSK